MSDDIQAKGLWAFLEERGVLVNGSDEEIKVAKKEYWKIYYTQYKQQRRKKRPEYSVSISKSEQKVFAEASKKHHISITAFIRKASLAYLSQKFIVPDPMLVASLEQLLSDCLNEIQIMGQKEANNIWQQSRRYRKLEKRITSLEIHIDEIFRNPPIAK